MAAYPQIYLNDITENQGKLFDLVARSYPDKDTEDFIRAYMKSETRKSIDQAQAYTSTMDADELWSYFQSTEGYALKDGHALEGFLPDWMGEFYARYQWHYDMPSAEALQRVPVGFLEKAYPGLHDLDLDLAVRKVGDAR